MFMPLGESAKLCGLYGFVDMLVAWVKKLSGLGD